MNPYTEATPLSQLHAPAGMILPLENGDYNIPVVRGDGATGKATDIRPPAQPLALVSGARTQFTGDTATLLVENGRSNNLWSQVVSIVQDKHYTIDKRDDASQSLTTDWISGTVLMKISSIAAATGFRSSAGLSAGGCR